MKLVATLPNVVFALVPIDLMAASTRSRSTPTYGVFDRGGTVFRDEETLDLRGEILHSILRFSGLATRTNTLLG